MTSPLTVNELPAKARQLRRAAIDACYAAQSGHPGSALSIMDMLVALYYGGHLQHDPHDPAAADRDYFLLSNGHACPGWYAVLADRGYFPQEELQQLRQLNAGLQGHPHRGSLPGIEMSSGSLGQGLSVGIGLAYSVRLTHQSNRVYVMMSDGDHEEGSTWEAIMFAPKQQLDNIIVVVDRNHMQIDGWTADVMPALDNLAAMYESFGWSVQEIDGHDFTAINSALTTAQAATNPAVIIANTVRGKGVSFMENSEHWHAGAISQEQYEQAKRDLT